MKNIFTILKGIGNKVIVKQVRKRTKIYTLKESRKKIKQRLK
jgi:hypothetical protein